MIIEELTHKPEYKGVTVRLDYDEVIGLANALYYLQSSNNKNDSFNEIKFKCDVLRDLVKHGMIQPCTVRPDTKGE